MVLIIRSTIPRSIIVLFHCSNLDYIYEYNQNYNNNYSFVMLICLQTFWKQHLFVVFLTQLFARYLQRWSSNYDCFVHTKLHTKLTEFLLLSSALSCPFKFLHDQSNECSWTFLPFWELYRDHIIILCICIPVFPSCLLLLLVYSERVVSCVLWTHCLLLHLRYLYFSYSWSLCL